MKALALATVLAAVATFAILAVASARSSRSTLSYVVPYRFVVHVVRTWTITYRRRGIPMKHSCQRLSEGRRYDCRLTSSARSGYIDLHITRPVKCTGSVLALNDGKRVMSLVTTSLGDFIPSCGHGHKGATGY